MGEKLISDVQAFFEKDYGDDIIGKAADAESLVRKYSPTMPEGVSYDSDCKQLVNLREAEQYVAGMILRSLYRRIREEHSINERDGYLAAQLYLEDRCHKILAERKVAARKKLDEAEAAKEKLDDKSAT